MFELVVIWEDGTEERYRYGNAEDAYNAGLSFKKVFGYQVMQTLIIEH